MVKRMDKEGWPIGVFQQGYKFACKKGHTEIAEYILTLKPDDTKTS